MESFDPVRGDVRVTERERECEEGSGEVRTAVEMLPADWEEVMGAGGDVSHRCSDRQGEDRSSVSFLGRAFS